MLLHEATRDSLIGEPDKADYIEIWVPPYKNGGNSPFSFEQAFFDAIRKIISFNGDTTFVQQTYDPSLGRQKLFHFEYALNNSEGDTVKLDMEELHHSKGFNTHIEIVSDNILIASYSLKLNHSNFLDDTSPIRKQNSITSADYYLVSTEINMPSEGTSLTESYTFSIKCNFECLTSKLHEVNMDFSYLYKGGYNVWLYE